MFCQNAFPSLGSCPGATAWQLSHLQSKHPTIYSKETLGTVSFFAIYSWRCREKAEVRLVDSGRRQWHAAASHVCGELIGTVAMAEDLEYLYMGTAPSGCMVTEAEQNSF